MEKDSEEIISYLELFEGKISLSEILSMDIPILHSLMDAKIKINKARQKKMEEEEAAMNAANQQK